MVKNRNFSISAGNKVILKRIAELTAGRSLQANIELIKSNALLGAPIAVAYQKKLFSKKM